MSDDREFSNIYTIPPNYTDSGKLMGGMLETRNTVEAGFLLVLVGYPEVKWLPVDLTTKIVIMTVTLIRWVSSHLWGSVATLCSSM